MPPQFLTRLQTPVPPTIIPRRDSGPFVVLLIIIVVLAGATCGGLYLYQQRVIRELKDTEKALAQARSDFKIDEIKNAAILDSRIQGAAVILDGHVYGSQVFNFIQSHTLEGVTFSKFDYSNDIVHVTARASGYLLFAQQIRHYRSLEKEIEKVVFTTPTLTDTGTVEFGVDITLSSDFLHLKP